METNVIRLFMSAAGPVVGTQIAESKTRIFEETGSHL
jgi:hypothetical protein